MLTSHDRVAWKLSLLGLAINIVGYAIGVLALRAGRPAIAYFGALLVIIGVAAVSFVIGYRMFRPTGPLLDRIWHGLQGQSGGKDAE